MSIIKTVCLFVLATIFSIRGYSQCHNSIVDTCSLPLYVINGVPMDGHEGQEKAKKLKRVTIIELLTIPTATSIYGGRGKNGAVLITTKHKQ